MKKIYIGAASCLPRHSREELLAAFGAEYTDTLRTDDSLLGASLLLDMLRYIHLHPGRRTRVMRNDNGKPQFAQCPRVGFSISHSHGVAVCAISDDCADIGADIEIYDTAETTHEDRDQGFSEGDTSAVRRQKLAERWLIPHGFDPAEFLYGNTAANCEQHAFTKAWTAFEAASKYTGGKLADRCGCPTGTRISHFEIKETRSTTRAGCVAICHTDDTLLIPCPDFFAVTRGAPRVSVLGVEFDPLTRAEAAGCATEQLLHGDGLFTIVTPNPVISMNCRRDPALTRSVNSASLSVPDGRGVIDAAKRQGTPLPERVCGIDLAEDILSAAAQHGWHVFLLGGAPGRAEEAAARLRAEHAGLIICGTLDGYGGISDTDRIWNTLTAAAPDILFVCLGSPMQERFIFDNAKRLSAAGVRLAAALGGSVDVWSGSVRRAPYIVIKAKLEWLWRCICQPRRLRVLPTLIKYRLLTK